MLLLLIIIINIIIIQEAEHFKHGGIENSIEI